MRARRAAVLVLAASVSLGFAAGGAGADPKSGVPAARVPAERPRAPFDFARGIGLVEGDNADSLWLMIADSTLARGDSLTLISDEPDPDPDSPPDVLTAAIAERLLRNPEPRMIPEAGDAFYRLVAPRGALTCCIFGYAVRAPRRAIRIVSGRAETDLDGDQVPEHFQGCADDDRLNAIVWSGEPFRGKERWSRAYAPGYEIEADCPDDEKP